MDEIVSETFGVARLDRKGRRRFDPAWNALLVSACLEPGASVARLALEHGINANLLWKWIQTHRRVQQGALKTSTPCAPAFVRVDIAPIEEDVGFKQDSAHALDLRADNPGVALSEPERPVLLSAPARMSVSLPNGVKLTAECGDVQAVTAIIVAVCDVQIGR